MFLFCSRDFRFGASISVGVDLTTKVYIFFGISASRSTSHNKGTSKLKNFIFLGHSPDFWDSDTEKLMCAACS